MGIDGADVGECPSGEAFVVGVDFQGLGAADRDGSATVRYAVEEYRGMDVHGSEAGEVEAVG